MRRPHQILAWLCFVIVLSGCALKTTPGVTTDSTETRVRAAISTAWREHIEAAKRKDVAGVAAMYADDAVYIVPGAQEARGRPAIEAMEAQGLASADVLDATHTTRDLRVFDDVAYEIGTIAGPVRPQGKAAQTVTFHFMAMWRRQGDGSWRLWHFVGRPEDASPPDQGR
ncbi:MAG: SgcJ/EcaC family oxidoreductase [Blastocatellales bacterium]